MQVFYCDKCGARFSDVDVQDGRGVVIGKAAFCRKCASSALGAAQSPPPTTKKPASKPRMRTVSARDVQHKGLGWILLGGSAALLLTGLLLYFRTSSHTDVELPPPPIKPVDKKETVRLVPQLPTQTPVGTSAPAVPSVGPQALGQAPNSGTAQSKTTTAQVPPQSQPDGSRVSQPAASTTNNTSLPPALSKNAPSGAVFFLGFEANEDVDLHDKPLRYADGIPGRCAGLNIEASAGKNFRLELRLSNDKPVTELTPASVVVFGIKAEKPSRFGDPISPKKLLRRLFFPSSLVRK